MTTTYVTGNNVKNSTQNSNERNGKERPRNFEPLEPLNLSLLGRSITVSLTNNRIESGILRHLGEYTMEIELPNKRSMIIEKAAIITVSVL